MAPLPGESNSVEKRFKKTGLFAVIGAFVVFVLVGAANGVLGELGVTAFQWLQQLVGSLITVSSLPWLILVLILIAALVGILIIWQRDRYTLNTTNRIVDLDNWLQRLVPNLVSASDLDQEMERLMYQLLQRATSVFDDAVHRASIFLPDSDGKHLRIGFSYQIPPEAVKRTVFNIEPGKMDVKRGIAGEAFLDEKGLPQVVHVTHEKGEWKSDREGSYVFFDKVRPSLPYQSCVCVLIFVDTSPAGRLGVLCFDSQSPTVFDSACREDSELQNRLLTLSARFAAALQIYKELQISHERQQQGGRGQPLRTLST
jgi:hypothetical protein